jgi:hypothetical protein
MTETTTHFTSTEQAADFIRGEIRKFRAEERAGTLPPPEPSPTPAADPDSVEGRQAAALAAADRSAERTRLVAASRELLRESILPDRGYSSDLADTISDEEALSLAGTVASEDTGRGYELPELSESEQAVASLRERFWNLAPYQRKELAEEAGANFQELDAEMRERDLST